MTTSVYINLAVENLEQSVLFFKKLGFSFNKKFTDDKAACMILNDKACVMLLRKKFFKGFTKKRIVNAHQSTEVLIAIDRPSRKSVNNFVNKAITLGAREARDPQDHGFMFGRSFHDPDGHIWEVFWMDESKFK